MACASTYLEFENRFALIGNYTGFLMRERRPASVAATASGQLSNSGNPLLLLSLE
jgi:hypothetical protein